eukprot:TRINITY_DN4710_c0_g1_i9.p3 TRINITY_DN4710_c0_g1~~TRINITY_DN4710_c0_g1_i9.p3  ORF type:complete len:116 (+),score=33.97 TRINITY_DN4710_c0_g1_i9:70-417(+)
MAFCLFFYNVFLVQFFFFFFSSRRRHTRCREVSWARRCVQETGMIISIVLIHEVKRLCKKRKCLLLYRHFTEFHIIVQSQYVISASFFPQEKGGTAILGILSSFIGTKIISGIDA